MRVHVRVRVRTCVLVRVSLSNVVYLFINIKKIYQKKRDKSVNKRGSSRDWDDGCFVIAARKKPIPLESDILDRWLLISTFD